MLKSSLKQSAWVSMISCLWTQPMSRHPHNQSAPPLRRTHLLGGVAEEDRARQGVPDHGRPEALAGGHALLRGGRRGLRSGYMSAWFETSYWQVWVRAGDSKPGPRLQLSPQRFKHSPLASPGHAARLPTARCRRPASGQRPARSRPCPAQPPSRLRRGRDGGVREHM